MFTEVLVVPFKADAAIVAWKTEPGTIRAGQPRTSALAITTALTLQAVLRLGRVVI